MIEQHRDFQTVPDDTILWQYMPIAKFLLLIKNRKIHFHRIDDFADKDEGVVSVIDKKGLPFFSDTEKWNEYLEMDRQRTFISCWIKSPYELSLMWDTYGKGGLAIKTTAGVLRQAFKEDEHTIYMIEVRYINKKFESSQIPGTPLNMLRYSTTKRNYFEQEKEVRLLYHADTISDVNGIDFDVDANALIKEIILAPTFPTYAYDLILDEVKEAGLSVIPTKSDI